MKKILLVFLFCTGIFSLYGQDSICSGLERPLVLELINRQFATLVSPGSDHLIGNFASVDLAEAEVNFAGNVVFNNGSVLGVKASGGITDGLLPIFSNTGLNSFFGLDLRYNFLNFQKKSIIYDNAAYHTYNSKKEKILHDYRLKQIEIENEKQKNDLFISIDSLNHEIAKKEKSIGKLREALTSPQEQHADSLRFQLKRQETELEKSKAELSFKEARLKKVPSQNALLFKLDNWKAEEIRKARSDLRLYGFKLGWFSVGYGISNNTFRLFDPAQPFDEQIHLTSFLSHSVHLQYNYYNLTPAAHESYYFSLGASFSLEDNLASLTPVEIKETRNYGPGSDERSVRRKYTAYQGAYDDNLATFSIYSDFYYFLFEDNKGAIHLFPEQKFAAGIESITKLGAGFVMVFKDRSQNNNLVNAEIYIDFYDIGNNRNSEEKLLARSAYGLRFTFPIAFNTKKQ